MSASANVVHSPTMALATEMAIAMSLGYPHGPTRKRVAVQHRRLVDTRPRRGPASVHSCDRGHSPTLSVRCRRSPGTRFSAEFGATMEARVRSAFLYLADGRLFVRR